MIRAIVKSVVEGVIKRFSATALEAGIDNREYFQHYGFSSRPLAGAEIIVIREGGHFIAVASDDRRYRISLDNGEVALYTDEGDTVHFKRGRIIEIIGGEKVTVTTKVAEITAATSATITSPTVTVVASSKVTLTTPLLEVSGNVTVGGNVTGSGNITAVGSVSDGVGSMGAMRTIYNSHTHAEHGTGGGTTSSPTQGM
jgi:phage gp45-like